jgi:tRNA modification GTPase
VLRDTRGEALDQALVLWFVAPSSYTGEDCFELHLHGGQAVLDDVTATLSSLGLRPAEPGEFTRRAVMHGRMDLLAAEAVADIIDAETSLQRKQALRQLGGAASALYAAWGDALLRLLAQQEALIDFPDEALPPDVDQALLDGIAELATIFEMHLAAPPLGERLRSGLVFAIVGPPNAGKSSLINALSQRDVAIVSPHAGTTRDVLEARVEIAGVPVTLLDTAGLRETADPVEAEGVRRARGRMAEADLILSLREAGETCQQWAAPTAGAPLEIDAGLMGTTQATVMSITTKSDLVIGRRPAGLAISTLTGAGMADLMTCLEQEVTALAGLAASPVVSRARHRTALAASAAHLRAALTAPWAELRGEELRLAMLALGRVTGSVGVEDILDSVFNQFCIGK